MQKEYKKIVSGKEFKIIYDKESLASQIESMRNQFEKNQYLPIEAMPDEKNIYFNKKQYNENIDNFLKSLEECVEIPYLDNCLNLLPKKKNGSFYKGRVRVIDECKNSIYICEWHNTWIYYELRVSAISDYAAEITLYKKVSTPA